MTRSVTSLPNSLPRPKKYEPLPKPQPPPIRNNRRLSRSLDLSEAAQAKRQQKAQSKTLTYNKDKPRDSKPDDKTVDKRMPSIIGNGEVSSSQTPRIHSISSASKTDLIEKESGDHEYGEHTRRPSAASSQTASIRR